MGRAYNWGMSKSKQKDTTDIETPLESNSAIEPTAPADNFTVPEVPAGSPSIAAGDTVRLKLPNGLPMVVESINATKVTCVWHNNNGGIERAGIAIHLLETFPITTLR